MLEGAAITKFRLIIAVFIAVFASIGLFMLYTSITIAEQDVLEVWKEIEMEYQLQFEMIHTLQAGLNDQGLFAYDLMFITIKEAQSEWRNSEEFIDRVAALNTFENYVGTLMEELRKGRQPDNPSPILVFQDLYVDSVERLRGVEQLFNDRIRAYNDIIEKFPYTIIGRMYGFRELPLYGGPIGRNRNLIIVKEKEHPIQAESPPTSSAVAE